MVVVMFVCRIVLVGISGGGRMQYTLVCCRLCMGSKAGDKVSDPLSGSSTGWTDEKHMLYISSLELSFVTKLYDGEVNSNGVFCWCPSVWKHKTHNGNHRSTQVDQVYCGTIEADGAQSRVSQAEHTSCDGDQNDRRAYCTDDDASTSDSRQTMQDERTLEGLLLTICTGMGIPFLEQSYQIRILLTMRLRLGRNRCEYLAVSDYNIQPAVRLPYLKVQIHNRRPSIMWKLITVVAHQISTMGTLHLAKATDQEDGLSKDFRLE